MAMPPAAAAWAAWISKKPNDHQECKTPGEILGFFAIARHATMVKMRPLFVTQCFFVS